MTRPPVDSVDVRIRYLHPLNNTSCGVRPGSVSIQSPSGYFAGYESHCNYEAIGSTIGIPGSPNGTTYAWVLYYVIPGVYRNPTASDSFTLHAGQTHQFTFSQLRSTITVRG